MVVDADTITIAGATFRLEGIDAPETDQTCLDAMGRPWSCGIVAAQKLSELLKGKVVNCVGTGLDQYGRTLAVCSLSDGTELNTWLVREGLALAFVRYSTRYVRDEAIARTSKKGLWAGTFDAPWDWRARARQNNLQSSNKPQGLINSANQANCNIKGNINARGERIYHVPGAKFYEKTRIDTSRGERWFCSTQEAAAAGWRPAQN